jgi:hypothetical protein
MSHCIKARLTPIESTLHQLDLCMMAGRGGETLVAREQRRAERFGKSRISPKQKSKSDIPASSQQTPPALGWVPARHRLVGPAERWRGGSAVEWDWAGNAADASLLDVFMNSERLEGR